MLLLPPFYTLLGGGLGRFKLRSAGALGSSQQPFDLSVSSTRLVADALVILEPGSICSCRSIDLSLARAYGLLSAAPFPYSGSPVVWANRIVTRLHVLLLLL